MRASRGGGLERDVDERLTQMRLRLLEEKLQAEKRRSAGAAAAAASHSGRFSVGDLPDDDGLDAELVLARRRRAELRDLLEDERRMAERLANERQRPLPPSAGAGGRRPSPRRDTSRGDGGRFSNMMEMMMMQNSQMHNLVLNQMLAKQTQPPVPPQQPPQQPPAPIFLPMPPGYDGYMQQHGVPQRPERGEPEPRRKPATPAEPPKEKPKMEATPESDNEEDQIPFPFPGNKSQQKLRRLAYTAFFIAALNRLTTENKFRPRFDFIFDVRLKEMLETLHRIYRTPEGHLYSITFATVMGDEAMELTELMNVPKTLSKDEERVVTQELAYCIENTVFQVTDIMPTKGILGTHRKSGIFELIRSGNRFPRGYFYDMEKVMMEFDAEGHTTNVSDCDGRMLIIGLFLMRALVETLYLKTEHYGMVLETTPKTARNIKLVATLLMHIYRKVIGQLTVMDQGTKKARVSIPDLPAELSSVMHSDQEIRPVLRLLKKSLDYAHNLLMHWSEEYVKRLRDAAFT